MISRRLIRIKVFKELFSRVSTGSYALKPAEKELVAACSKTRDLYCLMLMLPSELAKLEMQKIETGLKKFHPSEEEANPNMSFASNKFSEMVDKDEEFQKFCSDSGISWRGNENVLKKIYAGVIAEDSYKEFKNAAVENLVAGASLEKNAAASLKAASKLFESIYKTDIEDNEALNEMVEESSIWWTDDLGYVLQCILKNLKSIVAKGRIDIPEVFMKEDDEEFAKKLLSVSMLNYDEYAEVVSSYIANWNLERIVSTDLALIVMGVAEAINFETIPLKVTINEYVEISKYYSTPKSRTFVNGLLNSILQKLNKEGKIIKRGRGLVGSLD